ncbi:hypothetical protein [Nonomuraea sp. NPDC050643]|uniref:hypothetical protein n=1 Tax=Nonomuraea sp. NPDC050643 TaxID=3155660 RepID=UPI0033D780E6
MTVQLIHPERVNRVDVHHQVADTQGSRTVYLAGQVSWDTEGNLVGLDEAKAEQFVVGRERAAATLGVELQQPSTWIGVTSLAAPGYLVEVDAIAVLP